MREIATSAQPEARNSPWVFAVPPCPALLIMIAPPIPIKRTKTNTTVSIRVWADLVGRIKA